MSDMTIRRGGLTSPSDALVTTDQRTILGDGSQAHPLHTGPGLLEGLGWNRIRLTIQPLTTVLIDSGIGGNLVEGEPPLGTLPPELAQPPFSGPFSDPTGVITTTLLVPPPGTTPASRLMILPLPPTRNWDDITIPTEPFFHTATQTAWFTLTNTHETLPVEINLLAWDPLRSFPGKADTYTSPDNPNPDSGPF